MSKIILYGVVLVLLTASVVMGMDVYSTYQTLQYTAGSAALKIAPERFLGWTSCVPAASSAQDVTALTTRSLSTSTRRLVCHCAASAPVAHRPVAV